VFAQHLDGLGVVGVIVGERNAAKPATGVDRGEQALEMRVD
jgi:hypothetical protein